MRRRALTATYPIVFFCTFAYLWVYQRFMAVGFRTGESFVNLLLFHQNEWAVRYEIACPATDVEAARDMTRAFLRSLRECG